MVRGKLHLAGVLALVSAMLVSLAMVASAAVGKNNKPSAAQYQYKVTICHRTKSKKKPFHTITVSSRAVPAHLKHGDLLGPCPTTEHATTSTTSGKGQKGKKPQKDKPQKGNGQVKESGGQTTETGASSAGTGGGNGNGNGKGK